MADLGQLAGESTAMVALRNDLRRLLTLARETGVAADDPHPGRDGDRQGTGGQDPSGVPERPGPLVDLNCSAIPETLLEGELFGYERGAFTDARRAKPGRFQTSTGGVLFLDEVGCCRSASRRNSLSGVQRVQTMVRLRWANTASTVCGLLSSAPTT